MFLLTQPGRERIKEFVEQSADAAFTYSEQGMTMDETPPADYTLDRSSIRLGKGQNVFDAAVNAMRNWKMFDLSWVHIAFDDTPIEAGRNVAVIIKHLGFYSINNARIVYAIDEPRRFGFAYGTLAEHGEIGEERFMVELNDSDEVIYSLYALSRPGHFFAKLGHPYVRALQKQFARDSMAAMRNAANII